MFMNNYSENMQIDDQRLELENRIRNLLWTVSGDYTLEMKPDVSLFLRSKSIALYDGIKQGAIARFYVPAGSESQADIHGLRIYG